MGRFLRQTQRSFRSRSFRIATIVDVNDDAEAAGSQREGRAVAVRHRAGK